MVANDPAAAKRVGIPQSVGKEFVQADKGKKFGAKPALQKVNKPTTNQGAGELFSRGGQMKESKAMVKKEVSFMKAKGAPKSMIKHEESEMKKMASGGITTAKMGKVTSGGKRPHGEHTVQQKGHTKAKMPTMKGAKPLGMKKGGKAC